MKVWTAFLLFCAAASVVAWVVALCHENRVCPFGAAARFVRGLPWGGRLAILPLFAALIVYGSVKNSGEVENYEIPETHEMGTNQVFNASAQSRGESQRRDVCDKNVADGDANVAFNTEPQRNGEGQLLQSRSDLLCNKA